MKRYLKSTKGIILCLICILFVGNFVYKQFIQRQNIFDQMFYTRVRTHFDWWGGKMGGPGNKATSFSKMPQIEAVPRDTESTYTSDGYFRSLYETDFLSEGESLIIVFTRYDKTMEIIAVKRFEEFHITYRYTYDVKRKRLTETVELEYGERYFDKYQMEVFKEYSENIDEILLVVEEYGLTREDLLQYKQYFLYDKLLNDWLDANFSRFSINRWGRVEFIEALPLEISK